jgi:hypothetical protein
MITDDPASPGIYCGCGNIAYFKTVNVSYLLNHPDLRWVPTNTSTMQTVPKKVEVFSEGLTFSFPRYVTNNVTYLGKVYDTCKFKAVQKDLFC